MNKLKSCWAELLFLILFGLAVFAQLFIPPHIGVADNGDFARIIDKVGIQPGPDKHYMEYIDLTFPLEFDYNWKGYQSSELGFVLAAVGLNSLLISADQFHLLVLAAVHSLALMLALGLLVYALSGLVGRIRWVIYAAILIFFTDVGYIGYLSSIYSEPASLIFLVFTLGAALMILRLSSRSKVGWGWYAFFWVCGFAFIIAKPQNAAMGILVAFLIYRLVVVTAGGSQMPKTRKLTLAALSALGILGLSFLFFAYGLPKYYRSGDLWNSIFLDILGRSPTPEEDLEILGLPPGMIIYKGTNAFSEGVNRNEYEVFQNSWLYFRILNFYLLKPDRLVSLMDLSTQQAFELQQENLGNFEASSGKEPYEKSQAFAFWNHARVTILPKSVWTLVGLFVVNLGAVVVKKWRFDRRQADRLISDLHLAVTLMAVFQYLTVLMAEGVFELVKHMFLFNLLMDISLVFGVSYAAWLAFRTPARAAAS